MLRAPVLMRSIRNGPRAIRKNIRRLSISRQQGDRRRDNGTPTRPTFTSVSSFATELRVLITIRDRKSKTDGVFYKDDEDRFRQRYTLKLKTFSEYNVQLEVSPSLTISYLKIGGAKYDAKMTKMETEDGKTFCCFIWSTKHIKTTQRKYRSVLPCVIKFRGYREQRFEILVKFYANEESPHYSGIPLSYLGIIGTLSNDKQQKAQTYDIVFN